MIFNLLWNWAARRHNNKNKHWIADKYWQTERGWIFTDGKVILKRCAHVPIVRHPRLNRKKNPYLDGKYFEERKRKKSLKRKQAYLQNAALRLASN